MWELLIKNHLKVPLLLTIPIPITIHTFIFLNTSSSMNPLGKFVNMTAKFNPTSTIDLNKDESGKAQTKVMLQTNDSIPISPGNYTLGISATDGTVTKSIFRYLFVK